MRIAVCIKQVPDTTEIKIDPVKNTLIRQGVPSILNPFDKHALEAALELKDCHGAEVVAISMGPGQAKEVLREALALGVDKAYLVTDRAFGGSDTYATSYILAKTLEHLGPFDFIFGGKQAIDGDTGQTAPSIAGHLGIHAISHVLHIQVEGEKLLVERQVEEGTVKLESKLPLLATFTKESNKVRYATILRKIDSLTAEIPEITYQDLPGIDDTKIGLKGSPTKVKSTFVPKRESTVTLWKELPAEEMVENLIGKMEEAKLL